MGWILLDQEKMTLFPVPCMWSQDWRAAPASCLPPVMGAGRGRSLDESHSNQWVLQQSRAEGRCHCLFRRGVFIHIKPILQFRSSQSFLLCWCPVEHSIMRLIT